MIINKNNLNFLCEKYLLDKYNKFLEENNLEHTNVLLSEFISSKK
ncbi:MAG: hypothetical protein ACRC6U_09335 [Fusobacteriaceae bacterium]